MYNFFRSVFKTVTFKFAFHGIFYWILVNLIKRPSVNGQNFYPKLLWFILTCALAKKACLLAFFVWFSFYSLFVKGNIITIIHLCCTNFNSQFRKLKIQTQVCTQRCVHVYIIIITAVCVLFLIKLRWPSCETQLFNWWQLEYNSGYLHVALTETKNIFLLIKKHTSWLASLCYEWGKPITENSTLVNKWFTWIVSKVQQTDRSQFNWQLTYRYGLTTFGRSYFILALRPSATESSQKNFSWKKSILYSKRLTRGLTPP